MAGRLHRDPGAMNEHAAQHMTSPTNGTAVRVLVAIASHGTSNDRYLERIIREYRSMSCAIDIVVLSNIDKGPTAGAECIVGMRLDASVLGAKLRSTLPV